MLEGVRDAIDAVLGSASGELNSGQMALRALLVYVVALAIVRLGSKRFLAKASAFDVIVAIMLGSIMSRAITGGTRLFPTLIAGAVLVGLHWLFAELAVRTDWFGSFVKGERTLLIKDGEMQRGKMEQSGLTEADLRQALREQIRKSDPASVEAAYLERNGKISVVPKDSEPHVVDVAVGNGVKTVRIEME